MEKTRPRWPAGRNVPANWPRLAEAGGRPELDLALAGRAGAPEEGELVEASGRLVSTYACAAALECGQRAEAAGQDGV